jgi:Periplasmic binding protein
MARLGRNVGLLLTVTGLVATTGAAVAQATTAPPGSDSDAASGSAAAVDQTLTIGFAWSDVSMFEQVNSAFGTGDPEEQILAALDGLHSSGILPMNGVDVEFIPAGVSAVDGDAQVATCQKFGQDDQVFAVLSGRDFTSGAECVASRFETPVISVNQAPADLYAQAGPNFFTVKPDETTLTTSFAAWALANGYLDGKKVGIYWETAAKPAVDAMKQVLTDGGIEIVSEVESSGQGVGAEQDAIAAQRFQADGVDLVIPLVGSSSLINFTAAANDQGYTPGYIDFDWASHLSDVATAAYAPGQYVDVPALASVRAGDLSVGLSQEAEDCLANYESFSGRSIERTAPEQSGEYSNILITCDVTNLMVAALEIATAGGAEVTQESFRSALEQVTELHGAYWETIGYSADDHSGADTAREVRWNADCPCWEPNGDWGPLRADGVAASDTSVTATS